MFELLVVIHEKIKILPCHIHSKVAAWRGSIEIEQAGRQAGWLSCERSHLIMLNQGVQSKANGKGTSGYAAVSMLLAHSGLVSCMMAKHGAVHIPAGVYSLGAQWLTAGGQSNHVQANLQAQHSLSWREEHISKVSPHTGSLQNTVMNTVMYTCTVTTAVAHLLLCAPLLLRLHRKRHICSPYPLFAWEYRW